MSVCFKTPTTENTMRKTRTLQTSVGSKHYKVSRATKTYIQLIVTSKIKLVRILTCNKIVNDMQVCVCVYNIYSVACYF